MGLQVQPSDVMGALNGIGAITNPSGTALAFLGISESEKQNGIPAWAWCIASLGVGIYLGTVVVPQLRKK
jgi:predicted transcriptional regulator with HTH domain